ncbi:MAG TPA: DUF3492 domain-containing protein [Nitrososphaeria archaeon]|nr:MAG: hypothetical protein DRN68_01315 [Nitrososphaerota archaeon]HDJ66389.1 DUF3492 domain-containing protein [Nitrososphaeria archaeon]
MKIVMLNEGTYPYYKGGVSTWAHVLISGLREFNFITVTLTTKPLLKPLYPNPPNLTCVMNIPLWGTERLGEHLREFTVRKLIKLSAWTREDDIKENFVPYFRTFLREAKMGGRDPEAIGEALVNMHKFLLNHSFRKAFRSAHVWKAFLDEIIEDELYSNTRISYILKLSHVIRHLFRILAYDYPDANLYHSSASGLCGLIGVIKKIKCGTPYIVTEHGVYFRERLLDVYSELNLPEKIFWLNLFRAIALVNYHYADRILPVCEFNIMWETEFGVSRRKVEVIYNGVDVDRFKPMEVEVKGVKPIVVMSRIEKLKDILNMVEALEYISKEAPEIKCEIYGPIVDEKYFNACLKRAYELNVLNKISFMGSTDKPEIAYNRAEVVVQPSLSEGFPFTVIEAMSCGKPVVATNVGGVKEAIADAGIVVPPRSPRDLADAVLKLLEDEDLRKRLGDRARERVLKLFSQRRFIEEYRRLYLEIVSEYGAGGYT